MSRVLADVEASLKSWSRSPSAVFFTLVFPIVLMTVFGAIFQGGSGQLTLAVQDNDGSDASRGLVQALNGTGALDLQSIAPGLDAAQDARDHDRGSTLVIPQGYGAKLAAGQGADVQLLSDPSRTQSRTVQGIVRSVLEAYNLRLSGAPERVALQEQDVPGLSGGRFIDFFLPGVIGMTMATTSLVGGLEVSAKLKQRGILRKIATTPIRKWEWVLAKVLYQVVLGGISAAVIVAVGVLAFGVRVRADLVAPVLVVLAAMTFGGLALAMSRWVKEEDQANAAGSAVAFPMMFLSGTFFPIESMPPSLQTVAKALPLTYVNEGLRAAMITGNAGALALNAAVTAGMALLAIAGGTLLVSWKEV